MPGDNATRAVVERLGDGERPRWARLHPIAALAAVVDALDRAFYVTFSGVEPTGKRWLLAVDVSGSMSMGR